MKIEKREQQHAGFWFLERSQGGIFESVAFTLLQSLVFGKKSGGTFEGVAFTLLQRTKAFALPVLVFGKKSRWNF